MEDFEIEQLHEKDYETLVVIKNSLELLMSNVYEDGVTIADIIGYNRNYKLVLRVIDFKREALIVKTKFSTYSVN